MSLQQLLTIKINLIQMLADRGIDMSSEEEFAQFTPEQFMEYMDELLHRVQSGNERGFDFIYDCYGKMRRQDYTYRQTMTSIYGEGPSRVGIIFINPSITGSKIGIDNIRDVLTALKKHTLKNAIFIFPGRTTPDVKNSLTSIEHQHYQIFQEFRLTFNPTRGALTPKYFRVSEEEKAKVLKEAGVKLRQIQTILTSDPISKWYDYRPGDLIYIENDAVPLDRQILISKIAYFRTVIKGAEVDF